MRLFRLAFPDQSLTRTARRMKDLQRCGDINSEHLRPCVAYESAELAAMCSSELLWSVRRKTELLRETVTLPGGTGLHGLAPAAVAVISEMLAGLLDLSKFDSGSYKVRLETVRLTDVVEEVVGLFEDRAHRKNLRLRHEVEDVDIQTDAALLKQIIHNLISNAIKYTAKGEVAIVGGYGGAGSFLLQVRDTGIGIPRGNLDEIFMEYFRLPVHRNGSEDGLGIGLALVKRACSLLSYRVHVKSIVGGGSRFTLEIPAMRVAPHRRQVDLLPADTVPGDSAGNQEHCILLLENDEVAHDAMVRLVSDWGYRVIANTDGERMLQRLRTDPALRPDLIVSDMHLGGPKDGVQYIEAIREIMGAPRLPGLVVTGDLGRELQERAAKKGIRILYKPLQPRILKAAIRGVLRSPG